MPWVLVFRNDRVCALSGGAISTVERIQATSRRAILINLAEVISKLDFLANQREKSFRILVVCSPSAWSKGERGFFRNQLELNRGQ